MQNDFEVPDDWYRSFFTAPVNHFWEKMVPEAATAADLAFLRRRIGPPPARVLDLPSGAGRHALGLARAGYEARGIDISADAVARAAEAAQREGLGATFQCADMRVVEVNGTFGAVLCLGNSLAYFGMAEMARFVGRLAAAVAPGGRLILDTYSCAESILPLAHEREIAFEGGTYRSDYCYDARRSVLKTRAELRVGEETYPLLYAHQIVTSGALVAMVEGEGLSVDGLYADTDDAPYAPGSPRLLLVASRP